MNIFVGSLPFRLDESELRERFEKFGEVESVKIITDKFTGRSRGFGFVEMSNDEEALKAISELNGTEIGGREIIVNKSEERKDKDNSRRDNNFRGGGNRGGNDRRRSNY